jgi:ParB/RepB/Spo0J family partition protein
MARTKIKVEVKKIALDLINAPKMLVREDMGSMEELRELERSMRIDGQIQPILVKQIEGGRYDLIVGHRRVQAARMGSMVQIEAKIIDASVEKAAIMRYKENKERLDVSAYEEGLHLQELLENLGCSQAELADKVGKSAAYVAQHLAIMRGYKNVREALRQKLINFNQCRELMLMPDETYADQYLEVTIKGGAKAELIRQWRYDVETLFKRNEKIDDGTVDYEQERKMVQLAMRTCEICHTVTDPTDIKYLKVCTICHNTLLKSIEKFKP